MTHIPDPWSGIHLLRNGGFPKARSSPERCGLQGLRRGWDVLQLWCGPSLIILPLPLPLFILVLALPGVSRVSLLWKRVWESDWDSRASQKFLSPGGAGGLAEESICALGEGSLSFLSGEHTGGASRHSGFSLGVPPAHRAGTPRGAAGRGVTYGLWGATQQRGMQAQEAAGIRGEGRGRGDPGSMGTLGGTGGRGSCLHKVSRRAVRLRANPWTL